MSRNYLLMVGSDLLLAISLLLMINILILSSVISPQNTHPATLALLGGGCLTLLVIKYGVRIYRFYRTDNIEFKKSISRIILATFLPILVVGLSLSVNSYFALPAGVVSTTLLSFCAVQLLILLRVSRTETLVNNKENILLYGSGPLAKCIAEQLTEKSDEFNFYGYIQPEGVSSEDDSGRPVDSKEEILQAVQNKNISKIVVALSERRGVLPVRDMFSCKLRGIEIIDAMNFYEKLTGKLLLEHTRPGWFVFSKGFLVTKLMFKKQRIVDIVSATALLLATLPLFPLIALAIRMESSGDIFYRQKRIGFKEKEFELLKFRSMCSDAEKSGAVFAKQNDSRVTRVGRVLRKYRIDELPQLINILKGDMSFIGPRPERPEFVARYNSKIPYYSRRHSVRPGLTGWAQINYPYGESEEDAVEKLRYDLYFIKNFSIVLEMKIIIGTFSVVLFGRGAR